MPDRAESSRLLAVAPNLEVSRAGLEVAPPPFLRLGRRLLQAGLQVGLVRQALGAADRLQVKANVVLLLLVEDLQQVAAQLLARRAGEVLAAPDGADGVVAAVALLHQRPQPAAQRLRLAQRLLDQGGFALAEHVVEVAVELLARDVRRHGSGPLPPGTIPCHPIPT